MYLRRWKRCDALSNDSVLDGEMKRPCMETECLVEWMLARLLFQAVWGSGHSTGPRVKRPRPRPLDHHRMPLRESRPFPHLSRWQRCVAAV